MRLGVIGSVSKPTTCEQVGGVEVWTALFLLESIKRGYIFDLYALNGSLALPNQIHLLPIVAQGLDVIRNMPTFQQKHSREVDIHMLLSVLFSRIQVALKTHEAKYDIVINSSGSPLFPINWDLFGPPLVTVGHFNASEPYASFFEYFPLPNNVFYVFPTRREYDLATKIPPDQKFHIPHGIDREHVPFEHGKRKHLVWVGRIDPAMSKGLPEALTISKALEIPLHIHTHIEDVAYFEKHIRPLCSRYTCFSHKAARKQYFKGAKVFIAPLNWEEPFGLTFLEAMASGTPIVSFARGSAPEVLVDGETGFLVHASEADKRGNWITQQTGTAGLCEAIERIYALSDADYTAMQLNCKERVEKYFSVQKMVDGYEAMYRKIARMRSIESADVITP